MWNKKLFFFLFLTTFFACGKDGEYPKADMGYDFFPVAIGVEKVFRIDSIVYDDFNQRIDTFSYYQKEVFTDFINASNSDTSYEWQWSQKLNLDDKWQLKRLEMLEKNEARVVSNRQNLRKIEMVFPVRNSVKWNSNATNSNAFKELQYIDLNNEFNIENQTFRNTVKVSFNFFDTVLTRYNETAVYAKNIGLIYQLNEYIDLQKDSGLVYIKTLID